MKKMMMAASLALFLLACNKDDNNNNNTSMNSTDQTFMTQVSLSNRAEITTGQLAATKGANPLVRAYGQQMVTEHTQAQSGLQSIATSLQFTLADSLDNPHKLLMQQLNGLSGRAFDSVYIRSQVTDHQKTLLIFNTEISNGQHQSVKNYANQHHHHIQMHLARADSIRLVL